MQWTLANKAYGNFVALGLVVLGIAGGFCVATTRLSVDVDDVASRTAPNLHRVATMQYLVATCRSKNRRNVILAAERKAQDIEANRKQMEAFATQFENLCEEIGEHTSLGEVTTLTRDAASTMKDYTSKAAKVNELAAAFRAAEARRQMPVAEDAGRKVEEICAKIGDLEVARLASITARPRSHDRFGTSIVAALVMAAFLMLGVMIYVARTLARGARRA